MNNMWSKISYVSSRFRIAFLCIGAICLINAHRSFSSDGASTHAIMLFFIGLILISYQVYLWYWRTKKTKPAEAIKPEPQNLSERCKIAAQWLLANRVTVIHNLQLLKENKEPVILKGIRTEEVLSNFYYKNGDSFRSLVIGEFDENASFYPSITERILNMQSQVNYLNGLKKIDDEQKAYVAEILQDVGIALTFISSTIFYIHLKYLARTNGSLDQQAQSIFDGYVDFFKKDMISVAEACENLDHLNASIKKLQFKDYGTIEYDVTEGDRNINGYRLPKDMAMEYAASFSPRKEKQI